MGELRPQKMRGCEELNEGVEVIEVITMPMWVASPRRQKSLSERRELKSWESPIPKAQGSTDGCQVLAL